MVELIKGTQDTFQDGNQTISYMEAAIIFREILANHFDRFFDNSDFSIPDPDGEHRAMVREIIFDELADIIRHNAN